MSSQKMTVRRTFCWSIEQEYRKKSVSPQLEEWLEKFFKKNVITVSALVTVEEASKILRVTPDTLRKWSRSGKISCVRLSKVDLRYRHCDLNEFILSRLNKKKSVYN